CIAVLLEGALSSRFSPRVLTVAATLALTAGVALRVRMEREYLAAGAEMALGLSTRDRESQGDPLGETGRSLTGKAPPGAHVLIVAFYTTFGSSSGGAFWVDRPVYVTDSHLQGMIRLTDWDGFLDSLRMAAIDYIVISEEQFSAGRLGFSF